jgi:hypothetical protein
VVRRCTQTEVTTRSHLPCGHSTAAVAINSLKGTSAPQSCDQSRYDVACAHHNETSYTRTVGDYTYGCLIMSACSQIQYPSLLRRALTRFRRESCCAHDGPSMLCTRHSTWQAICRDAVAIPTLLVPLCIQGASAPPGYSEPSICFGTRAKWMRSKAGSREALSGSPKPFL